MHPALSIILFTTLSGAGLGLGFWTGAFLDQAASVGIAGATAAAIILTGFGLCGSVFHLRRPLRAWRALSQWRSSWLSREGILAPAALAALFAYAAASWVGLPLAPYFGGLAAVLCIAAIIATAMIYAQIRAVPSWNTMLTPLLYLAFAASSGAMLAAAIFGAATFHSLNLAIIAIVANLAAWIAKFAWWNRLDRTGTGSSSAETATGLGHLGRVRSFEPPHTGSNYLLDEMGYVVARRHSRKLRTIAAILGCVLATLVLGFGLIAGHIQPFAIAAAVLQLAGVTISRWLFFAEARHVVTLYY